MPAVEAADVRQLVEMLIKVRDLLDDLVAEPTAAIPPGLWQPLADAVRGLGEPRHAVMLETSTGALLVDDESFPVLTTAASASSLPLERAVASIVTEGAHNNAGGAFLDAGLTGAQLRFKKALLDTAYSAYVAGGRLPIVPKNDGGWIRRQASRLRQALAPAATLLGSLSHIPFLGFLEGVAEAVSGADHAIALALPETYA